MIEKSAKISMKILNATQQAKAKEKQADIEFSRMVRARDGCCMICGRTDNLNAHHIIPREYRPTRHDARNAITLCILHHKFSLEISPHKNAFVFFLWYQKNFPDDWNYLKAKLMADGTTDNFL